ncbi:MAG: glycoside hydrolase family 27 protein [Proteobacteria bacterium]|nr:glycoside hydrolase family 27 protein [Pseudomonadota bacterium]
MQQNRTAAAVALTLLGVANAHAQVNGSGERPYLGWTTWSQQDHFGTSEATGDGFQNEVNVKANSDAMRRFGLTAHGFQYINIDGDWDNGLMCQCGGPATFDEYGRPIANVVRFPHGMANLASYIHHNGQKAGIYWESGVAPQVYAANTPILGTPYHVQDIVIQPLVTEFNDYYQIDFSKPGAREYLASIVQEFAQWGFDYLKVDGTMVTLPSAAAPVDDRAGIAAISQAIRNSNRPIYLNLSLNLNHDYASWWERWANGRRIDGDVECGRRTCPATLTQWSRVAQRFTDLINWQTDAGTNRGWNDLDSLEVGNGTNTTYPANSPEILIVSDPAPTSAVPITTSPAFVDGLSNDERRTAMTLWSIAAAPLQLGDDLTLLDSFGVQLLTNDEVLAVDQSGHPGKVVTEGSTPVWAQSLCDGSYYVALFNLQDVPATVGTSWVGLGFTGPAEVRDLWSRQEVGNSSTGYSTTLDPHASALIRVRPDATGRQWPPSCPSCCHR